MPLASESSPVLVPAPSPRSIPEVAPYAIAYDTGDIAARFERLERRLAELEETNKVLTSNEAVYQVAYKQMEARLRENDEKHAEILRIQQEKHAQLIKAQEEHYSMIMLEKDDKYNDMFNTNRDLIRAKDEAIEFLQAAPKRARGSC